MVRGHALARPVRGERARWRAWAFWARAGLANASLSCARAVHGDDQGGQENLLDKKKVRGGGYGDRWHEGRHGAWHGIALALSRL
jgi:hypothetical protein